MPFHNRLLLAIATIVLIGAAGCHRTDEPVSAPSEASSQEVWQPTGTPVDGHYIVVMKPGLTKADAAQAATALAATYGLTPEYVYDRALTGFASPVPADRLEALRRDARVEYIEQDRVISLPQDELAPSTVQKTDAQTVPWGITRVHGGISAAGNGKTAWVIDTGIDYTHPDLTVDQSRSKNFVRPNRNANDDNGHGSHVSGTIAGRDNSVGVVGVAAGATLVAVKVLNSAGSGTTSGVIAGVNYVAANGKLGDVANMSLGGGVSSSLDQAVLSASANVIFCLAAGNSSQNANNSSPARVNGPNVRTVSAFAQGDVWASFSNFGNPPIDYCEPGVSVFSTYKNGGYATLSGTSMATPHLAGIMLLGPVVPNGTVSGDPDGTPDQIGTH